MVAATEEGIGDLRKRDGAGMGGVGWSFQVGLGREFGVREGQVVRRRRRRY